MAHLRDDAATGHGERDEERRRPLRRRRKAGGGAHCMIGRDLDQGRLELQKALAAAVDEHIRRRQHAPSGRTIARRLQRHAQRHAARVDEPHDATARRRSRRAARARRGAGAAVMSPHGRPLGLRRLGGARGGARGVCVGAFGARGGGERVEELLGLERAYEAIRSNQ